MWHQGGIRQRCCGGGRPMSENISRAPEPCAGGGGRPLQGGAAGGGRPPACGARCAAQGVLVTAALGSQSLRTTSLKAARALGSAEQRRQLQHAAAQHTRSGQSYLVVTRVAHCIRAVISCRHPMFVCLMGVAHWAAGAGLHEAGAGVQQRARGEPGAPVPAQARVPPVPGALHARD